jgi:two-component system LytT family response regulator
MTPLRILTVDDELLALRRLQLLLHSIPHAEHVGEASGCSAALEQIERLRPDVVLLDIQMRDGNGFEVIEKVLRQPVPPLFVFVTAFDAFAVRAFDSFACDFLLKPVERDRLARALDRARVQLRSIDAQRRVTELQQIVRNLRAARSTTPVSPFEYEFWLRTANGIIRIAVDEIECVSSEDEYVAIHTQSGSHLMRGSIRQFETKVEPGLFVRVHRRWLVKKSAIMELSTRSGAEVVLRSGRRLPAGRVYLRGLRREISPPPRLLRVGAARA